MKTEDAVVRAEQLVYNEETDEALFTENVVVEFSDGTVSSDRFLLKVEQGSCSSSGHSRVVSNLAVISTISREHYHLNPS